jgi:hypothetical protein
MMQLQDGVPGVESVPTKPEGGNLFSQSGQKSACCNA